MEKNDLPAAEAKIRESLRLGRGSKNVPFLEMLVGHSATSCSRLSCPSLRKLSHGSPGSCLGYVPRTNGYYRACLNTRTYFGSAEGLLACGGLENPDCSRF